MSLPFSNSLSYCHLSDKLHLLARVLWLLYDHSSKKTGKLTRRRCQIAFAVNQFGTDFVWIFVSIKRYRWNLRKEMFFNHLFNFRFIHKLFWSHYRLIIWHNDLSMIKHAQYNSQPIQRRPTGTSTQENSWWRKHVTRQIIKTLMFADAKMHYYER